MPTSCKCRHVIAFYALECLECWHTTLKLSATILFGFLHSVLSAFELLLVLRLAAERNADSAIS